MYFFFSGGKKLSRSRMAKPDSKDRGVMADEFGYAI
jgi:hypothetical protein